MKNFTIIMLSLFLVGSLFSQDISITVTNQNLALVKENRDLTLTKGKSRVEVTDVPSLIDATSVHISSVKNNFSVLEQNFEYDLIDANKILHKSLEKNIILTHPKSETVRGELLFSDGSTVILKTADGQLRIIPRNNEQQVILEEYDPEKSGLIIKPTLVWLLDSEINGKTSSEISYLTSGLNWHAEYVSILNEDDSKMDLSSWVSLNNKSGKTYQNTQVKLMAGDLNIVTRADGRYRAGRTGIMADASKGQFEQKEFFEYHIYKLSRKTTIKNNQTKQIQLFEPAVAKVKKIYNYNYQKDAQKVSVIVRFKNENSNGLGLPLPKGKVRIFKKDNEDLEFIGEDRIDHTAKDEVVKIVTGKAFDIKAERKVIERKKLGSHSEKQVIEIQLRNHKSEAIEVLVTEPIGAYRSWEIIKSSYPVKEKDANKAEFSVAVKSNDESTLTYEIIYNW